jgi:protein transport protein DSL1/ZW10
MSSEQSKLSTLITSLSRLDMLDYVKSSFQHDVLENIIQPVLMPRTPGKSREVSVGDRGIRVGEPLPSAIPEVLSRLVSILRYLQEKLPASVSESAAEAIIPQISTIFSESWLTPSIPLNLDGIRDFEDTLGRVNEFASAIETFGWHGQEQLVSWVNHFPRLWLTRRRVNSLDQVRGILVQSKGTTKEVERVEKEVVTNKDDVLLDTGITEDWDANWGSEGEEEESTKTSAPQESKGDDFDAWGLDEETEDAEKAADEDENDDDAWGWGDEADEENTPDKPEASSEVKSQEKDLPVEKGPAAREITLTERYTITDIPGSITTLLKQQISDFESLSKPE